MILLATGAGQAEVPDPEQDDVQAPGGESSEAPGTLTEALQKKGADAVDATPLRGESGANRCPVPECDLPGGHAGHHQDRDGRTFMYDLYEGRRAPTSGEKEANISSSSSSSSSQRSRSASSEELAVEELGSKKPAREERSRSPRSRKKDEEDTFLVFNLEVDEDDFDWLAKNRHRKRAAVWLSKKMSAKGQEVIWQRLPLKEKQEYDMAMAKEISQVAISRALRNLTDKEAKELDPATLMRMRWVLTRKQDGMAKARLVVLGFMAHNLTEVQTTSPTMSKVGRNVFLAITAGMRFHLRSGDVTSAFLQTGTNLEDENLTVLAPPELAAMFGAAPGDTRALRVREAFYGLAHAPRKWWEKCVVTLVGQGWTQLLGDKCLFALFEADAVEANKKILVGLAGLGFRIALAISSIKSQGSRYSIKRFMVPAQGGVGV